MKLFSLPDGTVDRKDRAQWLSCPFDLAFLATNVVAGPYYIDAAQAFVPGAVAAQHFVAGAAEAQAFVPGAVAAQGGPS